ncbi:MAG: aspartyl protease family protein [Verrucomicrobiaceae bacterium]|nr:aspartyl protease family protein [Verrucomicrobiaceae bacterium]
MVAPPPQAGGAGFIALPLQRSRQNHLLLRTFINGKPALLGVDTGAPVSAIAQARRGYFGLKPIPPDRGIPARVQINGAFSSVVAAKSLRIGALVLVDEPLVAIDLSSSARAAKLLNEPAIDGILGVDILFATKAVLDCEAPMLILNSDPQSQRSATGVNKPGSQRIPFQVSEGQNLYVNSAINGRAAKLMLDTGAFATLLHQPFVRRMKIPTRETPFTSAAVNLKQRGVHVAHIRSFTVGNVNLLGTDVGVINLEGLVYGPLLEGSPPVAGLLGAEILRNHHGVIDFGTHSLYLKR